MLSCSRVAGRMVTTALEALKSAPLNMMIMTEGCENQFAQMKEQLELCVGINQYTIYPLTSTNYNLPWQKSCRAVFIPPNVQPNNWNVLDQYINHGGCVISFNSHWNQLNGFSYPSGITANSLTSVRLCVDASSDPFHAITIPGGVNNNGGRDIDVSDGVTVLAEAVLDKESSVAVVIGMETVKIMSYIDMMSSHVVDYNDTAMLASLKGDVLSRRHALRWLLSKADIRCSEITPPTLSLCYLLASDKKLVEQFLQKASTTKALRKDVIVGRENKVQILRRDDRGGIPVDTVPSHNHYYLLLHPNKGEMTGLHFNVMEYLSHLQTKTLGHIVIYSPVISSTQTLFTGNIPLSESFTAESGAIAIASQQMRGKGRTGNSWISPLGCLMFTLLLKIKSETRLASHITVLQHLTALSFVHAVRSIPGYQELELQIKWPNDIYYGNKVKIGGILITTHVIGDIITVAIGCGINVNNNYPTISLNDCIEIHNRERNASLQPFTLESLLAITLKQLEDTLLEYENNELEKLLPLYYNYWLHSSARVQVEGKEANVIGIDDYGYLRVQYDDYKIATLHPDGNSFDLMQGLITLKS